MTNAEWLIENKIPFQNINLHVDNIKKIVGIYVHGYEKIEYSLVLNDATQEDINKEKVKTKYPILLVSTFSVLRVLETWLDYEADETVFAKKILSQKEKNWLANLIKPFYQKIDHLIDIEVMRHVKDNSIESDLNCIQIAYTSRIFDSDGNANGTQTFRQTIELVGDDDICANMTADKEYSVKNLGLGFDFDFKNEN